MTKLPLLICSLACFGFSTYQAAEVERVTRHDVVWNELGKTAGDSMPLGNGDVALNVWTEPSGDVVFYIAKNDAWSEETTTPYGLVKLGRVRVSITPSPLVGAAGFRQALHLKDGSFIVTTTAGTTITVWVDANHPVIRVAATTPEPTSIRASFETWRTEQKEKLSADVIVPERTNGVIWYHHNQKSRDARLDGRIFGGVMTGTDLIPGDGNAMVSRAPATHHAVEIHTLTTTDVAPDGWRQKLAAQVAATNATPTTDAWTQHAAWWSAFWDRSWIDVSGDQEADEVANGYAQQRFITACVSRGEYPAKFNGSLFVIDQPSMQIGQDKETKKPIYGAVSADFRSWGGQYWFQNTRPIYWPCLAAGDFDLMKPLFRMYAAQIPANAAQVKEFYHHDGAYLAETAMWYGGIPDLSKDTGGGSYTRHYYTPILELSAMIIDAATYNGDDDLVRSTLIPIADAGLRFFAEHFPKNPDGTLRIDPSNSIEMYWKVRDPLPDIAGLHWVIARLLELKPGLVPDEMRTRWLALQKILPPVPIGSKNGKRQIMPYADGQEPKAHNFENPELYAIYPFRLYGVGKPDLSLALTAFDQRIHKGYHCWGQDPVQAAYLGLADEARKQVVRNFTRREKGLRFPAFWNHGHDYAPDQCNGGNGMQGLQRMLLQAEGKRLILLPAWPATWNADFKLHAPLKTVITGHVEQGKLVKWDVTPAERKADVVLAADLPTDQH